MRHLLVVTIFVLLTGALTVFGQESGEVVYQIEGMDDVTVRNVEYRTVDGAPLTMDVYYPPDMDSTVQLPVVIFISGFPDSEVRFVDMAMFTSWGRLVAASGLIAVLYETEQADDLDELVAYIRQNAESLQMDGDHIAVWANSGNPPIAISYIMQESREYIKAAVFYYGILYGADEETRTTANRLCKRFGCYTADVGFEQWRTDLPMLVVRAGKDDNSINFTILQFVREATFRNVPITYINHADGAHRFDCTSESERSREIIAFTLEFLQTNLAAE